jgi:hypothetical protein
MKLLGLAQPMSSAGMSMSSPHAHQVCLPLLLFVIRPSAISALAVNLLATRKGSDGDSKDVAVAYFSVDSMQYIYGSLLIMIFFCYKAQQRPAGQQMNMMQPGLGHAPFASSFVPVYIGACLAQH